MAGCRKKKMTLAIAAGVLSLYANVAFAENCVRPPGFPESLPCPSQPHETVMQEHEDRINRLKRLGEGYVDFKFSTTIIKPDEHGLAGFPVDIPVLRVVADADVFFDTDRSKIRPEALAIIYTIVESLQREPPDVSLFVAGHTDSRGSAEYNLNLGTQRAEAVAVALAKRGLYQTSVYRVSFGEYMPLASNDTRQGRARNRRVEFLFAAKSKAIVEVLERQEVQLCAEHIDDAPGTCRRELSFSPRRVMLAPGQEQAVLDAEADRKRVINDPKLKPLEVKEMLKEIEVETDRREIMITDTRIEIRLGDR